jgi:hypothetical protein
VNAFKEWSLICKALLEGKQSLILRKGGIAEGKNGFAFEHDEFFLFPTHFHEQLAKTCFPEGTQNPEANPNGKILIQGKAKIISKKILTNWDQVCALEPFHFWKRETIRERFEYDKVHCIHLAVIQTEQFNPVWELDDKPSFGGCRSWVQFPELPNHIHSNPVLSNQQLQHIMQKIEEALGECSTKSCT